MYINAFYCRCVTFPKICFKVLYIKHVLMKSPIIFRYRDNVPLCDINVPIQLFIEVEGIFA